eukprot:scaffold114677_cov17-Tisochrysis_lutea.AAC.3
MTKDNAAHAICPHNMSQNNVNKVLRVVWVCNLRPPHMLAISATPDIFKDGFHMVFTVFGEGGGREFGASLGGDDRV